jgi:mannose-6-phosphate isomerase-like protein (cupin superfamily)
MRKRIPAPLVVAAVLVTTCLAVDPFFLKRQLSDVAPQSDELTAGATAAVYRPVFGAGDPDAGRLQGIARYGELTVAPGGASAIVSHPDEEQIYYVLAGEGTLLYDGRKVPVKKDDFMYLPAGNRHGIANGGNAPVRVLVMGYRIPAGRVPPSPAEPMIANSNEVPLQVLASHGPTTQFRLLMGQTTSKRDRLAAASEVTSLFIMDFAAGGTNIPHSHRAEEEIYLLLRGGGNVVAGTNAEGTDWQHSVGEGAAFYFAPGTRVGFYSGPGTKPEHDLILAVRSRLSSAPVRP